MIAFLKIASVRPCYSPSPGGEGRGEGELYTDLVGRTTRAFSCAAVVPQGRPKLARRFNAGIVSVLPQVPTGRLNSCSGHGSIKPNQGNSRLFKPNQGFCRKKRIVYFLRRPGIPARRTLFSVTLHYSTLPKVTHFDPLVFLAEWWPHFGRVRAGAQGRFMRIHSYSWPFIPIQDSPGGPQKQPIQPCREYTNHSLEPTCINSKLKIQHSKLCEKHALSNH